MTNFSTGDTIDAVRGSGVGNYVTVYYTHEHACQLQGKSYTRIYPVNEGGAYAVPTELCSQPDFIGVPVEISGLTSTVNYIVKTG